MNIYITEINGRASEPIEAIDQEHAEMLAPEGVKVVGRLEYSFRRKRNKLLDWFLRLIKYSDLTKKQADDYLKEIADKYEF